MDLGDKVQVSYSQFLTELDLGRSAKRVDAIDAMRQSLFDSSDSYYRCLRLGVLRRGRWT